MRRISWLDGALLWVLCFGVWPLADPGHSGDTALSAIDLMLHFFTLVWLSCRWRLRVERRVWGDAT
jgi:hypothetical protein